MMSIKPWTNGLSIPIEYIGYFDLINYKIAYYFGYYLYMIGITPNMITFIGLIFNLILSYGILINKNYFIIFLPLATLFDCMDGFNARMYNQCSKYGTLIDHTADWISGMSIFLSSTIVFYNLKIYWFLTCIVLYLQTKNFLYCGFIQQYNGKKDIALSQMLQKTESDHNNVKLKLKELKEYCSSNQAFPIFFLLSTCQYTRNL